MSTLSRPTTRRAGFTLIEVMLAMGILVLGATAIIAFLTYGASTARHAQLRTQAATAMDAVMADLRHELFPYENGELVTGPAQAFLARLAWPPGAASRYVQSE